MFVSFVYNLLFSNYQIACPYLSGELANNHSFVSLLIWMARFMNSFDECVNEI